MTRDGHSATPDVPPDIQDERRRRRAAVREVHDNPRVPRVPPLKRAIVWASVTDDALALAEKYLARGSWRQLVTADTGTWSRRGVDIARLRALGPVDVWCDCRVGAGTSPQLAIGYSRQLDVGWVGQAETVNELDSAVGIAPNGGLVNPAGTERATRIIANPNAWTPDQRDTAIRMIEAGDLSVSGEQYTGPAAMRGYSAGGVPVDSICLGVAMDGDTHHPLGALLAALGERHDADRFLHSILVWHGGGLTEADWQTLATL